MADPDRKSEHREAAVLGEWSVLVHCPQGLSAELAEIVAREVEQELEMLAERLTAILSTRYQDDVDVQLDR